MTSTTAAPPFQILERASEERAREAAVAELQAEAEEHLSLLAPVDKAWQPADHLPDLSKEGWEEEVRALREEAKGLSDELLVTLVGDMVTEEALPSYMGMLNRFSGLSDKTGDEPSAFARWIRGWTAEENRHGDLLNRFLHLSGRVNMRSIELTIHHLIRNGFNPGMDNDPYKGFIYTSFQERATRISHSNVGVLARNAGSRILQRVCSVIAGDEGRHEEAYKRFMDKIFVMDPSGAVLAFREMMRKTIAMPARLMDDGTPGDVFKRFSAVAQRIGVYTAKDYSAILEHLVERWKIAAIEGLKDEAAQAQDYLCSLGERYRKLAERMEEKTRPAAPMGFAWIFGRAV